MQIPTKPTITLKRLASLPKGRLIKVIRDLEGYLVQTAKTNDEMSWRGEPMQQAIHMNRSYAFAEAEARLVLLVGNADL